MKIILLALFLNLLFCVSSFAQEAEKIDEFPYINCEEYLARMDAALNKAHDNPSATIFVIIYEGKEQVYNYRKNKIEFFLPKIGAAKAKIRSMKAYIGNFRNFPLERFEFVEARFRENSTIEMWLVPNGAKPPKPTPTLTKMKYRKGKASGFCLGCCD